MMAMEKRVSVMKQRMGIFMSAEKGCDGIDVRKMMKRVEMIFTKIANVQQYFVQISYTEFQPNLTQIMKYEN
jgi:hypothetical protein